MKLNILRITVACLLATPLPVKASPFCYEPSPPTPPSSYFMPSKPTLPFCVDKFTNTHTCSDWEIKSYNRKLNTYKDEIEDYIRKLKEYVNEAQSFLNNAIEYANCEIRNLD